MKKMLFSAIALVTFTATSMAGEIEETKIVSEIKLEIKKQVKSKPVLVMTYCSGLYLKVKEIVIADGYDEDFASEVAFAAYKRCSELELGN